MKVGRGGIAADTESYMITSCFLTFLDGRLFEKNTLGSWKRREVLQKQQWSCIGSSYLLDFVRFIPFSFPELSLQTVFWNGWVPFCTTRVLGKEHFVKTFFSLTKTLFFFGKREFFCNFTVRKAKIEVCTSAGLLSLHTQLKERSLLRAQQSSLLKVWLGLKAVKHASWLKNDLL